MRSDDEVWLVAAQLLMCGRVEMGPWRPVVGAGKPAGVCSVTAWPRLVSVKAARRWLDSGRVSKKANRTCAQIGCGVREEEAMAGDSVIWV